MIIFSIKKGSGLFQMKTDEYLRLLPNETLSKLGCDVLWSINHVIENQNHSDHYRTIMAQDRT